MNSRAENDIEGGIMIELSEGQICDGFPFLDHATFHPKKFSPVVRSPDRYIQRKKLKNGIWYVHARRLVDLGRRIELFLENIYTALEVAGNENFSFVSVSEPLKWINKNIVANLRSIQEVPSDFLNSDNAK